MHRFFPFYLGNSFYPSSFRRTDYAPCGWNKGLATKSEKI